MVKRTLELFECDVCGKEGKRYQVVFEDGTKVMDRCPTHAKKLEALREEKGEWASQRPAKATFRKSTLADLRLAVAQQSQNPKDEGGGELKSV